MRSRPKRRKLNRETNQKTDKLEKRKKLYEALLHFYNFHQLKDFLFLKSEHFLKLCEINGLDWNFTTSWLNKGFLKIQSKKTWPFQLACPLNCKTNHYGELIFFSSQRFSQSQKSFLKKIAFFSASTLHFLENKEKMENIKQQWGGAFDSFSQAFCITDKNFKIIRTNQSFEKISSTTKTKLFGKKLPEVFPFPLKMPKQEEQEGSWMVKGERGGCKLCWEISFKTLFLRKENIRALLFLIKDLTEEMEIEEKLSAQAKERELGLIKGSIAHELNNPIAGIKALLSVIEKQISPRKALIKDSLLEMQKAVDRCHRIIKHLLFVSRHSGKGRPGL